MLRLLRSPPALTPQTPDEAVVARAQGGDAQAFRMLFERHVGAVRRFLFDVLRDGPQADDAAQETFARAHAQLPRLDTPGRFRPWLLGIARNVAFEARRLKVHEAFDEEDEGVPDAVLPSPNPEALLLDRELAAHLEQALATLSPTRRAALMLRLDHGLPYEEIARIMGWSLPTVKNEIHRARLKLRAALLPHVGGRR